MDRKSLAEISARERLVLSRDELLSVGVSTATIARRVKDGEWGRMLPSVYFISSDTPDFEQKAAAAMKWAGDRVAILRGNSAAFLHGLHSVPPPALELLVPHDSSIRSAGDRIRVTRTRRMPEPQGTPPRTSLEQTAVDLIHDAPTQSDVIDIVIKAIQKRMNIPRFTKAVEGRKHLRYRSFVLAMLAITDLGVESHLELEYLREVERRHGLPASVGQKRERVRGRWIRSDRWLKRFAIRIELDGELAHPGRPTDADVMRDNDVRLVIGEITLRYRWPQVNNDPCLVAAQVARAMQLHGWTGAPKSCSGTCTTPAHLEAMTRRAA